MTINLDYDQFRDMCQDAAFLNPSEEYISALWDYFVDYPIDDARVFFDNLFQNTAWYEDIMDLASEYDNHKEISSAMTEYEKGDMTFGEFEEVVVDTLEHSGISIMVRESGYLLVF